jgi:hypothetical protein
LVLETSQEFGGWSKLQIGLVPFALHPMRTYNLHKNVPTIVRNGVLMHEKIGEVCNQENKISTSNKIRHQFFTPLEWGWLVLLKEGDEFLKSLDIYTFKEPKLIL